MKSQSRQFFRFVHLHRLFIFRSVFAVIAASTLIIATIQNRPAALQVHIVDAETGKATPARVRITDGSGQPLSPSSDALAMPGSSLGIPEAAIAVMYGRQDRAEGFARLQDGAFYVDGDFQLDLPEGGYRIQISRGYEYRRVVDQFEVVDGESLQKTYRLDRWINMPSRGWYSADDHIHLRRSPREDPLILRWIVAEDVHVGNILQMGDFWATFYSQYAFGEAGRYREGEYLLSPGQEGPRTPEIGHTISLGADGFVRFRDEYYRYDRVFDRVHELGGVSGYAHQGMSFNGYRGLSMDVVQEKIDFLELLQFCVAGGPLHLTHYYHFLDLGFPLTATAGSDFPWCGRGPRFGLEEGCSQIGDARFYTYVEGAFSFENWMEGLKGGHTFVSSGPMLELSVNGSMPGDHLDVSTGTVLTVEAMAYGEADQIPLENLEIIVHGETFRAVSAKDRRDREQLKVEGELRIDHGVWIAARCRAGDTQEGHTTPVYVTVDGKGFHNSKTVRRYLDLTLSYLAEIERELDQPGNSLDNQIRRNDGSVRERIQQVRADLERLQSRVLPG